MLCASPNASLNYAISSTLQSFICFHKCHLSTFNSYVLVTFTIASVVFLLPVYVFILRLGFKQWRQQSFSTVAMSHFDLFTYHMVLFELLSVLASMCVCCGLHMNNEYLLLMGLVSSIVNVPGQLFLHTLTCAERYLAVVHPVTYLRLKGEKWIGVRNVTVAFVWSLSILITVVIFLPNNSDVYLVLFIPVVFVLFLVWIFCLSALGVLSRPGPVEANGARRRVDQSKRRAFNVIVCILAVLMLRLICTLLSGQLSLNSSESAKCLILSFTYWASLPSSLLMPLLYLQRKGLLCWKKIILRT